MLAPSDIAEVKEVVEPATPKEGTVTTLPTEAESFLKTKISDILGEDSRDISKLDVELKTLLEWAQEKGAKSTEDVLWEIRDLANHLGTPGYGESRLKFMYQYVYLLNESKGITDKLKKMEGFNAK